MKKKKKNGGGGLGKTDLQSLKEEGVQLNPPPSQTSPNDVPGS